MKAELPLILKVSLLNQFPFVIHGFGTRHFQEKEMSQLSQLNNLKPLYLKQAHSDRLHFLEAEPGFIPEGDALITSGPGLLLVVKTADCLPVLVLDPINRIIAAVHCGWRGTAARLLEKLVHFLMVSFNTQPKNLFIAFGPCISRDCYEVGEEVRLLFSRAGFSLNEDLFRPNPMRSGHYYLDLRLANRNQLLMSGVQPEKIEEINLCPHCHEDLFSFRRDGARCGRLFNFIALKAGD